jgi:phosphate transport system substrate-binding protein
MTAATWILVYKSPSDANAVREALKFFSWAYAKGGKMADELDYVSMPASVTADVHRMWVTDIKDAAGRPVFALTN